jgi:hypothetical protein
MSIFLKCWVPVFFLLLLCGCEENILQYASSTQFNGNKVHLVRVYEGSNNGAAFINYHFRGNIPILGEGKNRYFAKDQLFAYLRSEAHDNGYSLPSNDENIYLIDETLINLADYSDLVVETSFFNQNFSVGAFVEHPILGFGNLISETSFLLQVGTIEKAVDDDSKKMGKYYDEMMVFLQTQNSDGKTVVVYSHCEAGCDRTGQYVLGTRLRDKAQVSGSRMTYPQLMALNTFECGRDPNEYSRKASINDCKYIEELENLPDGELKCDAEYQSIIDDTNQMSQLKEFSVQKI